MSLELEIVNVLLIDKHALVRRGVRRILEDDQGIRIVGEAGNGPDAIRLARKLQPRVALMDFPLSGADGFDVTRTIVESCPQTAVVILSAHSGKTWEQRALLSGAHAVISKSATEVDLASLVRKVAAGEQISLTASQGLRQRAKELSARQLQILRLVVDGNSTKEIAQKLGLSANTVSVHRARIARSLGLRNTAKLVTYALQNGLADLT